MDKYSHINVMSAYVSTIRFALDKLELYLDELGDDILFDDMSPMSSFPDDVLGDDSLFAGYTDPWSPDDECLCDECRCDKDSKIKPERMSVGNIMDILNKTRKDPKPKGYWVN